LIKPIIAWSSCPIETSILEDKKDTGVTIIRMDSEMDHGPIVAVKNISIDNWPIDRDRLGKILVKEGAELISQILPDWIDGKIKEIDQDHSKATYTKKIEKEDGLIDLNDDPYKNLLKINAYHIWPSAYFFIEKDGKKIRVKITKASLKDGKLNIEKVIPEGKKEMNYSDL
jgi:methionyl-tRNA formyltransferase